MVDFKRCACCKEMKVLEDFYYNNQSKDRLTYYCKSCTKERIKAIQAKKPKREKNKQLPTSLDKCIKCKHVEISKPLFKIKGSKKLDSSMYCSYYKKFLGFVKYNTTEIKTNFCEK